MDRIKGIVGDIAAAIFVGIYKLPPDLRLLVRDVLEAAGAAIATIQFVMPQDVEEAKRLGITIAFAIGAAAIAVVRRWIWQKVLDRIGGSPDQ